MRERLMVCLCNLCVLLSAQGGPALVWTADLPFAGHAHKLSMPRQLNSWGRHSSLVNPVALCCLILGPLRRTPLSRPRGHGAYFPDRPECNVWEFVSVSESQTIGRAELLEVFKALSEVTMYRRTCIMCD